MRQPLISNLNLLECNKSFKENPGLKRILLYSDETGVHRLPVLGRAGGKNACNEGCHRILHLFPGFVKFILTLIQILEEVLVILHTQILYVIVIIERIIIVGPDKVPQVHEEGLVIGVLGMPEDTLHIFLIEGMEKLHVTI